MKRYVLLVGLLALVLLVLWMTGRGSEVDPVVSPDRPARAAQAVEADGATGPAVRGEVPGDIQAEPTAPSSERETVQTLTGVVRDATGRPVAGAEVTCTPVREDLRDEELHREMDWDWVRAATKVARTQADGSFRFEGIAAAGSSTDAGSVLWASHEGHASAFALASLRGAGQGSFQVIELPERAPVAVRVTRSGRPAAGARVMHTLDFWSTELSDDAKLARRFFLREPVVDDDGRAALAFGSGANRLEASHGALRSRAWTSGAATAVEPDEPGDPEWVELELLEVFSLSGQVFADVPDYSFEGVRYNVGYYSAEDVSDFEWAPGARRVSDAHGRFGPDTWIRPEHEVLHVWVSGGGLVPAGEYLPLPDAGTTGHVELRTQVGLEIAVEVVDEEGVGLEGVKVTCYRYDESDGLPYAGDGRTDDRGRGVIRGLRAGEIMVSAALDGYQTVEVTDERTVLPQVDEAPVRIVLHRARVVRGNTLHQGEPVTAFTVAAWNGDLSYWNTQHVENEDGEFLFEDVPAGEAVFLTAYAEGLPQSDVVPVSVDASEALVLVLPAPMRAVGRALDAFTLEPVPTATVQPLVSGHASFLTWRGSPMRVEPDGTFVLEGAAPGRGGLSLAAEGYEPIYVSLGLDATDVMDVGDLPLSPERTLHVQVVDGRATDYTAYRAWNEHVKEQGPVALSADGTCELPSYSLYYVHVRTPDNTLLTERAAVGPGDEPYVLFDLTHGTDVFAYLEPVPSGVENYTVRAYSPEGVAARSRGAKWDGELRAFLIPGLPEGDALLELLDGSRAVVSRQTVRIEGVEEQRVRLVPGGQTWRIRLVNDAGEPFTAIAVDAFVEGGGSWSLSANTDHDGIFEVGPIAAERLVLCGMPAPEFCAWGVEVELPPRSDDVVQVVLESAGRCYLRVLEQGRPVRGVRVEFTHPRSPYHRPTTYFSDAQGLVEGPEMLRGEYVASIVSPHRWRHAHAVRAGRKSDPIPIEVYSLGRIACEARDARGDPLAGARFELQHDALREPVSRWLAAGQVEASAYTLATDSAGRLVLDGMPRGTYAWTCRTPGGEVLTGIAELPHSGEVSIAARARED